MEHHFSDTLSPFAKLSKYLNLKQLLVAGFLLVHPGSYPIFDQQDTGLESDSQFERQLFLAGIESRGGL
jgi:hypothetical protein